MINLLSEKPHLHRLPFSHPSIAFLIDWMFSFLTKQRVQGLKSNTADDPSKARVRPLVVNNCRGIQITASVLVQNANHYAILKLKPKDLQPREIAKELFVCLFFLLEVDLLL